MRELDDFLSFIIMVSIIWGILNLILFIKIWGMTNDVNELKKILKHYVTKQMIEKNTSSSTDTTLTENDKKNPIKLPQKGDEVLFLKDNKTYKILEVMENGCILIDMGFLSTKWISMEEYEVIL